MNVEGAAAVIGIDRVDDVVLELFIVHPLATPDAMPFAELGEYFHRPASLTDGAGFSHIFEAR
jgi:hypothetical protein